MREIDFIISFVDEIQIEGLSNVVSKLANYSLVGWVRYFRAGRRVLGRDTFSNLVNIFH